MKVKLDAFPVQYPPIWMPSQAPLGQRGTRRISFVNNFGDGRTRETDDGDTEPSSARHGAIDIFGDPGLIVVSSTRGRIARHYFFRGHRYRGVDTGVESGNRFVVILDDSGFMHYYAHLSGHAPGLQPEGRVAAGQPIGWLGNSGNGPDPHLHYQVHAPKRDSSDRGTGGFAADEIDRTKVNPLPDLAKLAMASPELCFSARTLIQVDQGLHRRYHNLSGKPIRPRIVIKARQLAPGVADV